MSQKIFISYSHQDSDCANGIARFLANREYDVWIDHNGLVYGSHWETDIDTALRNADRVIAIISENSIRRDQVLREIDLALERLEREKDRDFNVIFVVIGNIHTSWIVGRNRERTQRIVDYMQKVQYVQLDARARITRSSMGDLLGALRGELQRKSQVLISDNDDYFYASDASKQVLDHNSGNYFYMLQARDLSISTVFPFALDNQWLPDEVTENPSLYEAFLRSGFSSEEVLKCVDDFRSKNLLLSLIHFKQVILNRAALLNSHCLQLLYCDFLTNSGDFRREDREAFKELLKRGAVVVFLYGNKAVTPYLKERPSYRVEERVIQNWNRLCGEVPIVCIRENWERPIDQHSIEFAKSCSTLAFSDEQNELIAKSFGYDEETCNKFCEVLKEIDMNVFLQTHVLGTGHGGEVRGYSRSAFYRDFIVDGSLGQDAVLYCIFDRKKPFHAQLKKMIDIFYNSIFVNYFHCFPMLPLNMRPEDTYLNQLYLSHGEKEVGVDEIKYAFSEFFQNESCLEHIGRLGSGVYLKNWSLSLISRFRQTGRWAEYINMLESILLRTMTWKVDFSEISVLIELFANSVVNFERGENFPRMEKEHFTPAYSFRICIGSTVMDVVRTESEKKIKKYRGAFALQRENNLSIAFQIGDLTRKSAEQFIFIPITIFEGKIDSLSAEKDFEELYGFFLEDCGFEEGSEA